MPSTTVDSATTSLTATAPASGTAGTQITASSMSSSLAGGSGPTGTITFTVFGPQASAPTICASGGTAVGTASVSGNGAYNHSASFTPTTAGTYWWYANYAGDTNNNSAASSCGVSMTDTIVASPTRTVLSSSKNPSTVGQQVTYTETIAPAPDAGNVSFTDHGRTISGCAAVSVGLTGQATCRQTYSAAGSQTIRASYSGSSRFAASQSAPLAQLIRRAVSALSVIGRSTSNRAGVTDKLRCAPSSLAPCRATVTLTTPKATQRGRSARGATAKRHRRTVIVATKAVTIQRGRTVTVIVKLNATGRKLLVRFGKLRVTVTITALQNRRRLTIANTKLTIKSTRKQK